MTPVLETKRLLLTPATLEECEQLNILFSDMDVVRYMTSNIVWPQPSDGTYVYTRDMVLPDMEKGLCHTWTLTEKASHAPMGRISLRYNGEISSEHRGYWLGARFHKKGYMTETLAATADYGFDVIGMPVITSRIADANIGSVKLQQASGALVIEQKTGHYVAGELPESLWQLTRATWRASALKAKYG